MAKKAKDQDAAAPPPAEGEGEAAPGGLKGLLARRRLLMMAGGGLFAALLIAAGVAWGLGLFRATPRPDPHAAAGAHGPPEPAPRPRPPHFMDLPEMTVNLSSNPQRPQYLRIKIALELADGSVAQQIQPVMPRVLDAFQVFLRELRVSDFEGSAGVHRVKEELTRRVNLAVAPARVDAVLLRELLIQ